MVNVGRNYGDVMENVPFYLFENEFRIETEKGDKATSKKKLN